MNEMTCTSATRGGLHEAVARAKYAGVRTVLTVRGEPAAVVVPLGDLAQLEQRPPAVSTDPTGERR